MKIELFVIHKIVTSGIGNTCTHLIPAEPTGKWKVINKDGDSTLYLEVIFIRKRREATGKRIGFFRTIEYIWVDHEVTEFIPHYSLTLKLTYNNECGCNPDNEYLITASKLSASIKDTINDKSNKS